MSHYSQNIKQQGAAGGPQSTHSGAQGAHQGESVQIELNFDPAWIIDLTTENAKSLSRSYADKLVNYSATQIYENLYVLYQHLLHKQLGTEQILYFIETIVKPIWEVAITQSLKQRQAKIQKVWIDVQSLSRRGIKIVQLQTKEVEEPQSQVPRPVVNPTTLAQVDTAHVMQITRDLMLHSATHTDMSLSQNKPPESITEAALECLGVIPDFDSLEYQEKVSIFVAYYENVPVKVISLQSYQLYQNLSSKYEQDTVIEHLLTCVRQLSEKAKEAKAFRRVGALGLIEKDLNALRNQYSKSQLTYPKNPMEYPTMITSAQVLNDKEEAPEEGDVPQMISEWKELSPRELDTVIKEYQQTMELFMVPPADQRARFRGILQGLHDIWVSKQNVDMCAFICDKWRAIASGYADSLGIQHVPLQNEGALERKKERKPRESRFITMELYTQMSGVIHQHYDAIVTLQKEVKMMKDLVRNLNAQNPPNLKPELQAELRSVKKDNEGLRTQIQNLWKQIQDIDEQKK